MATWNPTLPIAAPKARLTVSRLNEGKRAANDIHDSYFPRNDFRNLYLRTRQNNPTEIHLCGADQIVMQDGALTTDWKDLYARQTLSGAGGLDTGVMVVGKWYEIYAISKSSDNTKNLLLHRAREYVLDETQAVNDAQIELWGGATPATRQLVAQGFQTDFTGVCPFIEVRLQKTGTYSGTVFFTIQSDNAGSPSGVILGTSEGISATLISTTSSIYRFYFRSLPVLTLGVQYHLVAHPNLLGSATDFVGWRATTTVPYTRGTTKLWNGTSWSTSAHDQCFRIYISVESALTLPASYDQYCRIGFVYNNDAGTFTSFWQVNNRVQLGQLSLGVTTSLFPTLVDAHSVIPPLPVLATFSLGLSITGYVVLSGSAEPILSGADGAHMTAVGNVDSALPAKEVEVMCEGQACYIYVYTGGTAQIWSYGYQW
jgi:hypothetical protein